MNKQIIKLLKNYQENKELDYNNLFTNYKGNVSFMERHFIWLFFYEIRAEGVTYGMIKDYKNFKKNFDNDW